MILVSTSRLTVRLNLHVRSLEAKFDQRCCWWGCGTPGQVSTYEGRSTYFCNTDKCNGPGSGENVFGYLRK